MSTTEAPQAPAAAAQFRPGQFALRDTWIPIAHTSHVGRRPMRRAVHSQPVHIWREDGRIRLSEDQPGTARERRRDSEFTHGGDYPLMERYGYAWLWYGDPDAADPALLPNVPHIPVDGMPRRFQQTVVFDCTYELVCENLLDLTHADF